MFFHVPFFLNPFSEHDPYPQKYLIAKIGIDTAETELSEVLMKFCDFDELDMNTISIKRTSNFRNFV